MITIDCISDLHGYRPELKGGDLLIIAGDCTARDKLGQWIEFYNWVRDLPYKKKILIAGNHDGGLYGFEKSIKTHEELNLIYLMDSGTEICFYPELPSIVTPMEEGKVIERTKLKIWGSPYTPEFCDWHFMEKRGEAIKKHWDLIPRDTDILITHGPPFGILDGAEDWDYGKYISVGCQDLLQAVKEIKPKIHVFGHVHEGYGIFEGDTTKFINASIMNRNYLPVNKPIRIELP